MELFYKDKYGKLTRTEMKNLRSVVSLHFIVWKMFNYRMLLIILNPSLFIIAIMYGFLAKEINRASNTGRTCEQETDSKVVFEWILVYVQPRQIISFNFLENGNAENGWFNSKARVLKHSKLDIFINM